MANITGQAIHSASEIKRELAEGLCKPVQWTRSVLEMTNGGGRTFVELGPGQVLSGLIKRIDTSAARRLPGVLGAFTGTDLAAYGTLKCIVPFNNRDGTPMKRPPRPALATDKVRFVGDPIAFVVAETLLQAEAPELEVPALLGVLERALG